MDIEKIKRVNALARELKDHGIASDFEEAYMQAEKMIESGLEGNSAASDLPVNPVSDSSKKEVPKMNSLNSQFDALEVKNIQQRIESVEQQLNTVFMKMNEIISEINRLDKKKTDSPIEVRSAKEEKTDIQANLKQQHTESHPRSGD